MARPLLIALLTVTAVAGPVAALGPLPAEPLPAVEVTGPDPAATAAPLLEAVHPLLVLMSVSTASPAAECNVVSIGQEESGGPLPDLQVRFDPNDCISKQVNGVVYTAACVVERLPLAGLVDLGSARQTVTVQFLDLATGRPLVVIGSC